MAYVQRNNHVMAAGGRYKRVSYRRGGRDGEAAAAK